MCLVVKVVRVVYNKRLKIFNFFFFYLFNYKSIIIITMLKIFSNNIIKTTNFLILTLKVTFYLLSFIININNFTNITLYLIIPLIFTLI